jgi:lambda repressor-like predicted transcriptional regulator
MTMARTIEIPDDWPAWKREIAEFLNARGLSMKEASLKANLGETFVRDALKRDKEPGHEKLVRLKDAIGMESSSRGLRHVTVAAHVQAGAWTESWEWEDDYKYSVSVPDLPELRPFRLYAAETRGPSMNKRYPEKTVVVFTNVEDTRESPMPGKRYVIERRRASGESEHTVKLLFADADGKLWLMPESDDPRFQAAISVDEGTNDGDLVSIIGRVRFAVTVE